LEGDILSSSFNKGFTMEVRELNKKQKNTLPASERDELVKKMRKEDDKLRKGMFEFLDAQGGWLEFAYRKYPGETIQMYKLFHGEICELHMGLVKHLNNTKKKIRRYSMELPASGQRAPRSFETISRVRFTPMDVM
jgi:hypothetical protein